MGETLFAINHASVKYGQKSALRDISLSIDSGRFYGIIGPNGSGKTTLINLLMGYKQTGKFRGEVHLFDQPVAAYKKNKLAQKLASVPQDISLGFDYTVYEVVLMGRNPYIQRFANPSQSDYRLVEQNLKLLDLWHYRDHPASQLSGGEKQRVIIARALTQDTPVLLLDEATSNLDIQHTITVMKLLRQMTSTGKKTIIATIHDLNLACAFCTHLIALKDGQLHAAGKTSEIISEAFVSDIFNVKAEILSQTNKPLRVHFNYDDKTLNA